MTSIPNPYDTDSHPRQGSGRIALIFGLIVVAISVVQQIVNRFVPYLMNQFALGVSQVGVIFTIGSIIIGVVALVAVVFGATAVRRRDPDAALGGVGLGIGLITLVNVVVGLIATPLTALFLG